MKTTMKIMMVLAMGVISLFGMGGIMAKGKSIEIDMDTFPDDDFQMYVSYAFDTNQDGKLSEAERKAVKEIDISDCSEYKLELEYNNAVSLKGIEYFPNLEKLDCSQNSIEKLDVSKLKNLKELRCMDNNIKTLNLKKNSKLNFFACEGNKIKKLDVSKNINLMELYCGENEILKIDLLKNKKIKILSIGYNKIYSLDLKKQKNWRIYIVLAIK